MRLRPWRTGLALAITFAISYGVCAALYAIFPERGIDFLNALFHGLDFHRLGAPAPLTITMFLYPLAVFVAWGFLVGALFAFLHNRFRGERE